MSIVDINQQKSIVIKQWNLKVIYLTEKHTTKSYHVYRLVLMNVLSVKHKLCVKKLNLKRNTYTIGHLHLNIFHIRLICDNTETKHC